MITNKFHILSIALTAVILSACGSGHVMVLEPVQITQPITGATIEQDKSTVDVDPEIAANFEKTLREKLTEAGFKNNNDITLQYRFIQINEGNRFSRWFFGGIGNAGEGTLMTEIKYLDANRQEVGKVQAEGKIGSGAFGGGFSNAIEKSVDEIVEYTNKLAKK